MDKTKEGWNQGREEGMAGVAGEWQGENAEQQVKNGKKKKKKKNKTQQAPM